MLTLMPTAEALTVDGGGVPPHLYPHGEETLLTITRAEGYDAGYDAAQHDLYPVIGISWVAMLLMVGLSMRRLWKHKPVKDTADA